jgi:hypothetical protein
VCGGVPALLVDDVHGLVPLLEHRAASVASS